MTCAGILTHVIYPHRSPTESQGSATCAGISEQLKNRQSTITYPHRSHFKNISKVQHFIPMSGLSAMHSRLQGLPRLVSLLPSTQMPYLITFPMSRLYPMSSRLQGLPRLVSLLLTSRCPISGYLQQGLAYQAVTTLCHCYGRSWCPISSFLLTLGLSNRVSPTTRFSPQVIAMGSPSALYHRSSSFIPFLRGFYSTVSPTKPSPPQGVHTVSPDILSQRSPLPTWSLFPLLKTVGS